MCMGVGLFTQAWATYQQECPQRSLALPLLEAIAHFGCSPTKDGVPLLSILVSCGLGLVQVFLIHATSAAVNGCVQESHHVQKPAFPRSTPYPPALTIPAAHSSAPLVQVTHPQLSTVVTYTWNSHRTWVSALTSTHTAKRIFSGQNWEQHKCIGININIRRQFDKTII